MLERRADLMALTEASRKAVLTPVEPGDLSRALRALIAARASERLGGTRMKDHYYEHLPAAGTSSISLDWSMRM
ncbi:hypothetical protein [Neorhizobium sp. DT-125]|uniref:hypothetical protein n=1 Tax=Neorhizobium sp. DT-125 TaxID=3396163 RepID=UPI003F1E0878